MKTNNVSTPLRKCFRGKLFGVAILFSATLVSLHAQDVSSRNIEQIYQFDERGDAKIEWRFQLDASGWAQWKANYGDHPDLLLRMVKYQLAAAVIDDYSLEKDDMHRSAVSHFSARALARYRGNGQFEIPVNKNMKLVSGSGLEWAFTSSTIEEGQGILNITYRPKLPAKAQNPHMVNGNDFNRLVYSLDLEPARPKALLGLGIMLLVAAAILGALSFRFSGTPPTRATPPPLPT